MPYISNTDADRREMLAAIGVNSLDELFSYIPGELRVQGELPLPAPLAEPDLVRHVQELAARNCCPLPQNCYLGGGAYVTMVPEAVKAVAMRSEYYTAYTPYQAEVSQGTLQTIFEFQTMLTGLTGMDVANASMYDGSTAVVEAIRMAVLVRKRTRVVLAGELWSHTNQVINTYLLDQGIELVRLPLGEALSIDALKAELNEQTACVVVQSPNCHGLMEDVAAVAELTHGVGAALVHVFDPLSIGLFASPGELGADIAVAEGQSLCQPLQYGGPYIGFFTAKAEFTRFMPGRLIGATEDAAGNTGYVLTFQTREQHIRREKATSNICTNQALVGTFATIHMALLGPEGLRDKAQALYTRASWLAEQLEALPGVSVHRAGREFFREFVVSVPDREALLAAGRETGILVGLPVEGIDGGLLVTVNEVQNQQDYEGYLALVRKVLEGGAK